MIDFFKNFKEIIIAGLAIIATQFFTGYTSVAPPREAGSFDITAFGPFIVILSLAIAYRIDVVVPEKFSKYLPVVFGIASLAALGLYINKYEDVVAYDAALKRSFVVGSECQTDMDSYYYNLCIKGEDLTSEQYFKKFGRIEENIWTTSSIQKNRNSLLFYWLFVFSFGSIAVGILVNRPDGQN